MKVCLNCTFHFEAEDWCCPQCGQSPALRQGYLTFAPALAEDNNGFRAHYFDVLARLEARNFWFRARNSLVIWALQRYFPHAVRFLEIGCGTGFVLSGVSQAFPELQIFGSDIFTEGLVFAQQRTENASLFQMDARCIPFEEEFDAIGAFDVLEHVEEDTDVLRQMFKAIRPGGGILLTVPQHRFLWSFADEYSFHKRRYTRMELIEKVKRAGFDIVYTSSFISFLLPAMLLSRLKKRVETEQFDPTAELNIHPVLNTVFEKILWFERLFIKCGVSLPAGGSLLVIARRMRR
jgi:SAM-dependent methyltransferase